MVSGQCRRDTCRVSSVEQKPVCVNQSSFLEFFAVLHPLWLTVSKHVRVQDLTTNRKMMNEDCETGCVL